MAAPQTPGFVGGNAGLLGVEQDPTNPNKYVATFANGNVIPLTGQAGKNLYERQQAVKQLSAPTPAAAPAQRERVGTTTVEAPQKIVGGLPPDAQPQAPEQQQPTGPQSLGYSMKGLDPATGKEVQGEAFRMPDGSVQIRQAARPGSPGGLTGLGKQTMEQYGQAQTLAAQHSAKAAEYQQIGTDLAVKDAQAQQAYLEEMRVQKMLEARDAAEEEAAIQKKVAGLEANYEKARRDFAEAKVDPNRFVKESPGGGWLLGLSAALGAFGAGMARTPNFAMEFINGRIADDIRAQESAINVKGRDADNQLATLTRSLGDLSLAKKAYRQLKLEEASVEAQRITNQYKGQQIAANAMMVAEQSAAEGIRAGEEKSRAFVEHVMKDKLYFRQGSAGSRGGFIVPTQESFQSARGSNIDVEKLKLQQNKAEAAAGKGPHLGQRSQAQIIAARNARSVVNEVAGVLGMERDKAGTLQDPSLAKSALRHVPFTDTQQQFEAAKLTMIAEIGKAQIGGVLSEGQAHEGEQQIKNAKTPGELGSLLRHYDHVMGEVERNVRDVAASSGPGSDNEREDDGH